MATQFVAVDRFHAFIIDRLGITVNGEGGPVARGTAFCREDSVARFGLIDQTEARKTSDGVLPTNSAGSPETRGFPYLSRPSCQDPG
jgi:hypothetical protein